MKTKDRKRLIKLSIITALSGLFAISLINPNYEQAKADSITTTYSLTLSPTNIVTNNSGLYTTKTAKYSNSNTAINVKGNFYEQQKKDGTPSNTEDLWEISIYETALNNIDVNQNDMMSAFVFGITPYNINIETTIKVRLGVQLRLAPNQLVEDNPIFIRTYMYRTATEDWNKYIDNQQWNTNSYVYGLIQDIESPSNLYDYTKTWVEDKQVIGQTSSTQFNAPITIETDITITPSVTNYFVFHSIPFVNDVDGYMLLGGNGLMVASYNSTIIEGVNVIPSGNYEVIDIPSIMFQILTMPFSFISVAFNLTLFPNTPYQINISNLFLIVIAVLVFIWLIGLIIKLMGKGG